MSSLAAGLIVSVCRSDSHPRMGCGICGGGHRIITQTQNPPGWKIETAHALYQMAVASDGIVVPVFYGPKGGPLIAQGPRLKVSPQEGSVIREVPFRGGFVEQMPAVEVLFADGTRDTDLVYASSAVTADEGYPCLRLDLKDPVYGLEVSAYYRVIPELDHYREMAGAAEFRRRGDHVGECPIVVGSIAGGRLRPGPSLRHVGARIHGPTDATDARHKDPAGPRLCGPQQSALVCRNAGRQER